MSGVSTRRDAPDSNVSRYACRVRHALWKSTSCEYAFADIRGHQMAMLAGMRVAFEAMLTHFQPDQLQEQFDRQLKRNALSSMTARLHYWDFYRDRHEELTKDPEATFRRLFGEEFAKAYEEQLRKLKADRRAAEAAPRPSDV